MLPFGFVCELVKVGEILALSPTTNQKVAGLIPGSMPAAISTFENFLDI